MLAVSVRMACGVLSTVRIHSITLMLSMKAIIIAMAYHACEVNGAV
jgi:hypothetical protein